MSTHGSSGLAPIPRAGSRKGDGCGLPKLSPTQVLDPFCGSGMIIACVENLSSKEGPEVQSRRPFRREPVRGRNTLVRAPRKGNHGLRFKRFLNLVQRWKDGLRENSSRHFAEGWNFKLSVKDILFPNVAAGDWNRHGTVQEDEHSAPFFLPL